LFYGIQGCASFEGKQQDEQGIDKTDVPSETEDSKGSLEEIKGVLGLFPEFARKWQGKQDLAIAKRFMFEGDYNASILYNKKVLDQFSKSLGDQALFQLGMAYAHPANPKPDNHVSLECFQKIIKEYPKSSIRDEAGIWIPVIQKIINNEKKYEDLKKQKSIENNKRLGDLLHKNENLQHQIESLQNQIKKLKEIDLGIEDKKRVDLPEEKGEMQ
jgi:hypothetical protein